VSSLVGATLGCGAPSCDSVDAGGCCAKEPGLVVATGGGVFDRWGGWEEPFFGNLGESPVAAGRVQGLMAVGIGELSGADSRIERLRAQECWREPKRHGRAAANCYATPRVLVWAFLLRQQFHRSRVNRDCRLGSTRQAQRMNWVIQQSCLAVAKAKSNPSRHYSVSWRGYQKTVGSRMSILVQMIVR